MFRSLIREDVSTSLQRMLLSAKVGDSCGLWLWCLTGWLLEGQGGVVPGQGGVVPGQGGVVPAQQYLVYLALAEMAGTSGQVFVDLVKLHRDGTCTAALRDISVFQCF